MMALVPALEFIVCKCIEYSNESKTDLGPLEKSCYDGLSFQFSTAVCNIVSILAESYDELG